MTMRIGFMYLFTTAYSFNYGKAKQINFKAYMMFGDHMQIWREEMGCTGLMAGLHKEVKF